MGRSGHGRPRDPSKDAAILSAVLELLSEVGYDGLAIEGVAARSGTSKTTIYRRWADKRNLVIAAITAQQGGPAAAVDTGSLRGDLVALCRRLAAMLAKSDGQLIVALLKGAATDPSLGELMEATAGHTGARMPRAVLERAIDRGELPPGASAYPYEEAAAPVLILRALTGAEITDAYLEHLVDSILLPALAHDGGRRPPPGPALFSGDA